MQTEKQDGQQRKNIQVGSIVEIVQKHDQSTGKLTEGVVQRILTKSQSHPHGIKVKLASGKVGRVKKVL
ncbi:MAG: YwbE family protein [Chloroflexota bacterium]